RQFHDFAFNPAVAITGGTHYAIVVRVLVGAFTWYTSSVFDTYAGGQLYISCSGCAWFTGAQWGQDFAFKTWVATVAANHPPVVAADTSAVSGPDGSDRHRPRDDSRGHAGSVHRLGHELGGGRQLNPQPRLAGDEERQPVRERVRRILHLHARRRRHIRRHVHRIR